MKFSFFHDVTLLELSPLHRLLFAGLWCIADREGRLLDRPKQIKHDVLPVDECDVNSMLDDLQKSGFILRYKFESTRLIEIVNFEKHQSPHPKEAASDLPASDEPCNYTASNVITRRGPEFTSPANLLPIPSVSLHSIPSVTVTAFAEDYVPSSDPPEERLDPDVRENVQDLDPDYMAAKSQLQTWPSKDQTTFWGHWRRKTGIKPDPRQKKWNEAWLSRQTLNETLTAINGYTATEGPYTLEEFKRTYFDWLNAGIALERATSDSLPRSSSEGVETPPASPDTPRIEFGASQAIECWNNLVPSRPCTDWDPRYDVMGQLRRACEDPIFVENFADICGRCDAAIKKHNPPWLTFRWILDKKNQQPVNWWRILKGCLDSIPSDRSNHKPTREQEIADRLKRMGVT